MIITKNSFKELLDLPFSIVSLMVDRAHVSCKNGYPPCGKGLTIYYTISKENLKEMFFFLKAKEDRKSKKVDLIKVKKAMHILAKLYKEYKE